MDTSVIGMRIRYERQRFGLTLKELGNILKVSEQCISGWEHGRNVPDIITLNTLSKIFNISIEEFLKHPVETDNQRMNEKDELPSTFIFTKKDLQLIAKLNSLSLEKRHALETLLEINKK